MGIVEEFHYEPLTDEADPDDYRPNSELAIVIDPKNETGEIVESLTVLFERMAPGDHIPLHTHTIDEAIIIDEGIGEVTLGAERRKVGPGTVVFVPAGTPHGTSNLGDQVLRLHAIFPTQHITIQYLDRNPWPGTEGQPPKPPFAINVRELLEGNPAEAIVPIQVE